MKNNKLKVILLVAGEGKRLHPYTSDRPKCMVEVEGISLIDRQLSILKSEGLDNIIMIGGYKSEMLKGKVQKLKHNPKYKTTESHGYMILGVVLIPKIDFIQRKL